MSWIWLISKDFLVAGRLAGWLVGGPAGWLAGWLAGRGKPGSNVLEMVSMGKVHDSARAL